MKGNFQIRYENFAQKLELTYFTLSFCKFRPEKFFGSKFSETYKTFQKIDF